jgi:DNA-binding transcriptional LysR family regulator
MVSLRQLRYLGSLAETRHFGRAAEACAVSQPALSMQIKELEDELHLSLVERRKSGIELTEQGEEVVRRARTILASVRDLVDYAKHQEGVLSGVLKLGAIPSIAPYLLPAALPELNRRFPTLNLQLRETQTANLLRELVTGDLDVILIALPIDEASSLATIVQMVAHGYGITLLPEMAIASEVHHRGDIRLLRFRAPEPKREIGLGWRKTSPRKADFQQLGDLLREIAPQPGKQAAR